MRVIVDTSVWSLALRRKTPVSTPETDAFSALIEEGRVTLIGPVRQEILSGIRHEEQFDRLRTALEAFPDEPVTTKDFEEAARIYNTCMRKGVLNGNTDSLIAAVAINRDLEIFSTDKDFLYMASVVPIKLYQLTS